MTKLNFFDIQGFVARGYNLPKANLVLAEIIDAESAQSLDRSIEIGLRVFFNILGLLHDALGNRPFFKKQLRLPRTGAISGKTLPTHF